MVELAAALRLELGGSAAPDQLMDDVLQVSVEESLHLPAMFTLIISNPYLPTHEGDRPWKHEPLFRFGQTVRIGFLPSVTDDTPPEYKRVRYVLDGEITAMEAHFNVDSQAPMVIRGYDVSHRLHRGRHCRSFQNMTDGDIVAKIAQEVGITLGSVDTTPGPHGYSDINHSSGYVFQENQTNMQFLRERAARIGYELFVEDGRLYFRKPTVGTILKLKWLEDILSFRVRMTSAEQVSAVEVRGWDYSNKQAIVSTRSGEQVLTKTEYGKGSGTSQAFSGKPGNPTLRIVDQPVFTPQEADILAQALFDEVGGEFIQADARGIGNPQIRPGRMIELENMGKYSGRYYVTETRHFYDNGYYLTEFSVRGLRSGDLLTTLFPQNHLQPGQTHLVGIVTENKDPKGWGRVRVKFPTLTDNHNSYWARMVQVGAGASRGFDCLPELGDEVLVAFEHGDIHRPYILGGVWNGKDPTPEAVEAAIATQGNTKGTVRLRTFKTRVGHYFQFSEEDPTAANSGSGSSTPPAPVTAGSELFGNEPLQSLKGIHWQSIGGHSLDLCDPDKAQINTVRLKTQRNHKLSLTDAESNPGIALQTEIGQSLSLVDLPVSSPSAPQINLNTRGNVVINAGARAIAPVGLPTAKQFLVLGAAASRTPPALSTFLNLLAGKITHPLQAIELSAGFINHLSLGGVTLAAGPLSVAKVLPEQTYIYSPGMTLSAAMPAAIDLPTPGCLNLNATATIQLTATTSVVITAPRITLNGNVLINGSLLVNGRSPVLTL